MTPGEEPRLRVGVRLPQYASSWPGLRDAAIRAESLGFASAWLNDHLWTPGRLHRDPAFDVFTGLAAVAAVTDRIALGTAVMSASYRPAALAAKMSSVVDVISGGRVEWGIGAGWYENEYRGYGYDYPKPSARIGMLRETVEIVKSMWTQRETTYEGKHYKLVRANCDPKPLQQPHPPVWIGGGGEQLTLRVVAEHANVSNFGSSLDEFIRKREILKSHCKTVGRDESEIRKTISSEVFIRETEAELLAAGSRSMSGEPLEVWREKAFVGTPDQVSEKISRFLEAGCTGFVPWCPDYPSTETIELFAKKVMPNFR